MTQGHGRGQGCPGDRVLSQKPSQANSYLPTLRWPGAFLPARRWDIVTPLRVARAKGTAWCCGPPNR